MTNLLERLDSVPRLVWPVSLLFLVAAILGGLILDERATLAEKQQLETQLTRLKPAATAARLAADEMNQLHRAVTELQGWTTSRVLVGEALSTAARIRPTEMTWTRVVVQQSLTRGAKEPHIAYRPRIRSTSLIIAGNISGPASDLLVRTYLAELTSPLMFGTSFGRLTYGGLSPNGIGTRADYTYSIEGRTPSRRIDRTAAP